MKSAVEAIIFASGEPVERLRLIEVLGCSPERLDALIHEIQDEYDERGSAVELLCLGSQVQFATRPAYAEVVRSVLDLKKNQPLSPAAFEVLAIVAYNQPVTRSFIEQVRGVDCGGVLNTLCQRQLVEECGRLELPGRPLIYCTTAEFLKCFCMSTLAELPDIPDTRAAAAALENIQKDENVPAGQMSIL
jgi:segregation and condensation protein B